MSECVYLLQEREFIKTKENIYKIGRTSRTIKKRLTGYPKKSKLIFHKEVQNSRNIEKIIKNKFCEEFKQRKDIGTEYFEGNVDKMITMYKEIIKENDNKILNSNSIEEISYIINFLYNKYKDTGIEIPSNPGYYIEFVSNLMLELKKNNKPLRNFRKSDPNDNIIEVYIDNKFVERKHDKYFKSELFKYMNILEKLRGDKNNNMELINIALKLL